MPMAVYIRVDSSEICAAKVDPFTCRRAGFCCTYMHNVSILVDELGVFSP